MSDVIQGSRLNNRPQEKLKYRVITQVLKEKPCTPCRGVGEQGQDTGSPGKERQDLSLGTCLHGWSVFGVSA